MDCLVEELGFLPLFSPPTFLVFGNSVMYRRRVDKLKKWQDTSWILVIVTFSSHQSMYQMGPKLRTQAELCKKFKPWLEPFGRMGWIVGILLLSAFLTFKRRSVGPWGKMACAVMDVSTKQRLDATSATQTPLLAVERADCQKAQGGQFHNDS